MRCALLLFLTACGAAAPTAARPADEPAFMAAVRADVERHRGPTRALEHVTSLTDASGPRLAGSEGDRRAVAWGVRYLTELGLANVRAEPVTVRVWERGEARLEVIGPVPQRLPVAALGGSVGTPEGGIEAEVVRVESLEAMEAMDRSAIEGRIVFVDRRMERARDGHGYGDTVGVRWSAAGRAAPLGARAVIIRSIGTDATRFPHTGVMGYPEDAVERIPAAAIANADADVLARWFAAGETVRLHLELGCRDAGEAQSANVIGEVVGREHPEEIVVLGAHLDSWDLGRGAVDDGAGVAIVIEAARLLLASPEPPARTVRVVLFANEENGGAGAEAYVAAHAGELPQHVLAGEADFGDGAVYGVRTPLAPERSAAWARLVGLMTELGVAYDGDAPHGGADVEDLREAGSVPLFDAMQDGSRYFDLHHTANDVITEIDPNSLDQAARIFAAVASWASREPELSR
jgi:hypothetical protein